MSDIWCERAEFQFQRVKRFVVLSWLCIVCFKSMELLPFVRFSNWILINYFDRENHISCRLINGANFWRLSEIEMKL